jgi:hypothetical protein
MIFVVDETGTQFFYTEWGKIFNIFYPMSGQ